MFGWFRSKDINKVLNQTKRVKVCGIIFKIKKVDPMATMDGSSILQKQFDTYSVEGRDKPKVDVKPEKVRTYFRDLFCQCVVEPKLYRKQEEALANDGVWVDGLLNNWEIVEKLHQEIFVYSYGKKKLRRANLLKTT